jgi:hypothetical protein
MHVPIFEFGNVPDLETNYSSVIMVELLGGYSRLSDQTDYLRGLALITPNACTAAPPSPRQRQRRLGSGEANELGKAYLAGATMNQLAKLHGIHRSTVTAILERQRIPTRQRGLSQDQG